MSRQDWEVGQHADPVDAGSELAEAERAVMVEEARLKGKMDWRAVEAGETERLCAGVGHPDDCGEFVESIRLAHGFIRCIACQTKVEKQRSLGLRGGSCHP